MKESGSVLYCHNPDIHWQDRENQHGMTNETFKDIEKLDSDLWEATELAAKIQENFEELGV